MTVRLESNLGSLLANYEEKESTSSLSEMSSMRERLRATERELRSAEGARDKLQRDTEWLLDRLEQEKQEKVVVDSSQVESLRAERIELENRVADLEAELNEARLESRRGPLAAAERSDNLKRQRDDSTSQAVVMPPLPVIQDSSLVEELSTNNLALRSELESEKAEKLKLERELREERSFKSSALVAQERVRCLEKLLDERLRTEDNLRASNQRAESLEQAVVEWKAVGVGHNPGEARSLAAKARRSLLNLEKEKKKLEKELEEARSEIGAESERAEAAKLEAEKARRELESCKIERDKIEHESYLTTRENEALKEIVKTFENPGEDSPRLKECVEQFERALSMKKEFPSPPPQPPEVIEERVVHLKDNPLAAARKKKREAKVLEKEDVDETKLNSRLKERFREHLNWFREAVYLLTGFKIDMTTTEGGPHVRLRSMFAEDPQDALLFHWTDDGVQLLATPFANKLDERLFASLTLSNSVPAFLANVQLDLFERQTLMPA